MGFTVITMDHRFHNLPFERTSQATPDANTMNHPPVAASDNERLLLAQRAEQFEPCIQLCMPSCIADAVDSLSCGALGIVLQGAGASSTASCHSGSPLVSGSVVCQNPYSMR